LSTEDIAKAATAHNILLPDFTRRILTLEHYMDIAMKHRYELKSLDRQIAVNKAQLRNSYGNIFPSPQFWMGSSQVGNPPTGPRLNAYYFGVNVPSNLTDFQQGDIAKFKAVSRQLKYQTGAVKNVITSEVSSAYNNVLAARQKLRIYQEHVLADSYEVARLARRSYEVGQSDITSTIQAQQNNVQIRTQYLEAIQLYQQAFTELERACGTPLLEGDE
jgi:outer membrane protein TolC